MDGWMDEYILVVLIKMLIFLDFRFWKILWMFFLFKRLYWKYLIFCLFLWKKWENIIYRNVF